MMSIYDYSDYRQYLNAWIDGQAKTVKGLKGKLASAAAVSSTLISLILKGEKHLSLEQASEISDFIGHDDKEAEYFFLLVELGKAGSFRLQQKLKKRADDHVKKLSKRVKGGTDLSDEVKSIFYSSWVYSAIRNLSATPGKHDVHSIAKRLNLPTTIVNKAIQFLLNNDLCKMDKGHLTYGPKSTWVPADSPYVVRHHQNWRMRGLQVMDAYNDSNMFFTGPMSLSAETAEEIRRLLPKFIEEIAAKVGPSKSEKVYCLNIDWFEY